MPSNTAAAPPTSHAKLRAWVDEVTELAQPDAVHWCDGSAEEYDQLCARAGRRRHLREALGRQAPELLPRPLGPRRRRPGRGPHLHLLPERGGRRPDQQLARSRRDAGDAARPLQRLHAGPHHVRGALLDGPDRLSDRPRGRAADRLRLRGGVHADHDPHGQGRARRAGRRRRLRALPALGRGAERQLVVALQRRQQVHRPLPRDPRDLVVRLGLRRQRAAGQEVLRAADRLGHGSGRGLAGRAHADPQADLARGRGQARGRRVPVGLRQDQPGHAHPHARGLGGRDGRRRHRLDEVRRRRPPARDQPGVRLLRRGARHRREDQPQRHGHRAGELDLHQLCEDRRRRRVVGGDDRATPRAT